MSIYNDDRRYGTDEERREWEQEMMYEARKQAYEDEEMFLAMEMGYAEDEI